jgi:hypothetical protein
MYLYYIFRRWQHVQRLKSAGPAWIAGTLLALLSVCTAVAQMQAPSAGGMTSRATQLPLSGRQQGGGVIVNQSAGQTPGSSVNTLNTQIQVESPYNGSVAGSSAPAPGFIFN